MLIKQQAFAGSTRMASTSQQSKKVARGRGQLSVTNMAAKDLYFNAQDGLALKKMQKGVDKLSHVVGVTLGPKGRNVVLETKFGSPKIVNDGVTVAKEVELEDPVENIGAKLVRQASQKTNDQAGDGTTSATVLSAAMITEGMKIVMAGTNPVQLTRGMEKTVAKLIGKLKELSKEVADEELSSVAAVSAGGNMEVGEMIAAAMAKVGRKGVITLEEARSVDNNLIVVEGMQFDRGFIRTLLHQDRMICDYEQCKLLLVDKKISSARDMINILEAAIKDSFPLLIMAEDIEQEAMATLVVNKLRGALKVCALKAPGFGERKSQYLEDIAILTGGTVVKEEVGLSLDKVGTEVLGNAARVTLGKESCTIVGDGSTDLEVKARVKQINRLIEVQEADYEKEKLSERAARLSGGVAIIQVGAQTETELKEKKLRVEDALNATKAAVEEGIVIGGGTTFLKLGQFVDGIKEELDNDEQRLGADIIKRALSYPMRLVAFNSGVNGSVTVQNVLSKNDPNYGFNAATGEFEDLMQSGIIDPTKVIRCCLENSVSVAKIFLTSDVVVCEIPEDQDEAAASGAGPMDGSGYGM